MDTLEVPVKTTTEAPPPATRQHPRTINLEWPRKLRFRRGGKSRLCGIEVYYDFDWETVLGHDRSTFHNGKRLAELAQEDAHGKTPALLLTARKDVQEKRTENERYSVLIVNIDSYLATSQGHARKKRCQERS